MKQKARGKFLKCPLCKGRMALKEDIIKEDGVMFNSYKCKSCGEELLDSNQLKALAKKYHSLRKAKDITFAKWGNSLAVRIPTKLAKDLHINAGTQGLLLKERGGLKILV